MTKMMIYIITFLFILSLSFISHAQQIIEFNAASVPLSSFKVKKAKAKGIDLKPEPGTLISGFLYEPETTNAPGIVMVHDCRGVQQYQKDWAQHFQKSGYVVLLIDSYRPRGKQQICTELTSMGFGELIGGRSYDILGALNFLSGKNNVDVSQISLMTWDPDTLSVISTDSTQIKVDGEFKNAVSFYTDCPRTSGGNFAKPVLVLIGEKNDWWVDPLECQKMANAGNQAGSTIELIILPDAHYAFDDTQYHELTRLDDVNNLLDGSNGATVHYNEQATAMAKQAIEDFLSKNL